jgi:glyoxylase-like metal-dependent hydrolase (beta-lactamase superfamily II)
MIRSTVRTGVLALTVLLAQALLAAEASDLTVTEIADGVFAVVQPFENRFNESNSGFFVGESGVLVIDSQSSPDATRKVIAEIRARTELPVRHLVLTHWHGDHVQGITAYREAWPTVEVIGHLSLEEDIRGRAQTQIEKDIELYETAIVEAEGRLSRRESRDGEPLDDDGVATLAAQIEAARETVAAMRSLPTPFAVPDLSYDGELVLGSGSGTVRLLHRVAHTRGDTLVYLPEAGVLFTGDVLDDLPYGGHGYPRRWIDVFGELRELDFEVVVPGHGQVRRGKEHLATVHELFRSLVERVDDAVERGLDLEGTQAELEPALASLRLRLVGDDETAARAWNNFIPATIERAWLDARDELPDQVISRPPTRRVQESE